MTDVLLLSAFSAAVGFSFAACVYASSKRFLPAGLDRSIRLATAAVRAARSAQGKGRPEDAEAQQRVRGMAYGLAAGGAAGLLAGAGSPAALKLAAYGAVLGGLAGWFAARGVNEARRSKTLRELAVLYESVLFFTQAGYSIPQALQLGSVATPGIRPHVSRCLSRYTRDRIRALEQFAHDVGLPEATLLSSLLIHAEESGMEMGRGALAEESRALEELRRSLLELKVVSKPVYFAVYRGLPVVAACGVAVGPLVYRLVKVLQTIAGMN